MTHPEQLTGRAWLESPEKRREDIAITIGLLPTAISVVGASAAALAAESRKNPFFKQQRPGKDSVPFGMHKLNTLDCDPKESVLYHGYDDPRATKVGKFLRRTGFDEIPQFINVLKGDMSIVGVRPLEQRTIDLMQEVLDRSDYQEWHQAYVSARPGLVCLFQNVLRFMDPETETFLRTRAELDIEYVENASRRLDREIMADSLTVGVMLIRNAELQAD